MYNDKQYDAAKPFFNGGNSNVTSEADATRIAAYDLYENIFRNSVTEMLVTMRGEDQSPVLVPNSRKVIEATNRFLGVNLDYFVDPEGPSDLVQLIDLYFKDMFKKQKLIGKFNSNKRWGLVRGDAYFYVDANPAKPVGQRIQITELDPRCVFEIEEHPFDPYELTGVHLVDLVQDFRSPDKPDKKIARRRTFRKAYDENGVSVGISSELLFFEVGKWDDRTPQTAAKMEQVPNPGMDQEAFMLPATITMLPVYKWSNDPAPSSSWGTSQLAGLETLLYAINQSLTDEDATLVFQGLGMYVTDAAPPIDPTTGNTTDWNIGPKQIIEISNGQRFDRVTGVSTTAPFLDHMNYIDAKMTEAAGVPQTAIGKIDVNAVQSGIALKMEMMPIIAANAEKEFSIVNAMDAMFTQITQMWLPAFEPELFGSSAEIIFIMQQMVVTCLFDDPMPKDRDAMIQETIQLDAANLILKSMSIAKLRELGWEYPDTDPYTGQPLDDYQIAGMLLQQTMDSMNAMSGMDPYASGDGSGDGSGDAGNQQKGG